MYFLPWTTTIQISITMSRKGGGIDPEVCGSGAVGYNHHCWWGQGQSLMMLTQYGYLYRVYTKPLVILTVQRIIRDNGSFSASDPLRTHIAPECCPFLITLCLYIICLIVDSTTLSWKMFDDFKKFLILK